MATEQAQLNPANVQNTLNNLGQNKKMVMVGAGVITLLITIGIIFFAYSNSTNKGIAVALVKEIEQDRAFEIISKLKSADIDGDITESEKPGRVNVEVYQKDFDKAAIALSRSDLLQADGFNLFDKSDWAASDYDKRIKMMRAVNGDLSRIVSRISGIKWSTVRVNIPEPQLFTQNQAPTTATVQVELLEDGEKLSRAHVKSIINLLIGYVPNLQRNNISIIDTAGQTYSAVESEEADASELLEESEKVNKVVQKKIEEYLEPLIGYNNYIVRVSSEINRKKVEESATTFTDGAVGQEQIGDERLGAPPQVTIPNETGEGQEISIASGDQSMSYTRTNRVTQRYPSYKQKTTKTPAGRISKITVAVAINDGIPAGISLKQLREGIAAITSPNTSVDDVKITIAEFANGKTSNITPTKQASSIPTLTSIDDAITYFKGLPSWASYALAGFGLLILLSSFGKRPATIPQQSTISQINQTMQRQQQFQNPDMQISAGMPQQIPQFQQPQQIVAKEPDFSGIITGLKEAAVEKPEFLANKLQIWLEDGR